MEQNAVRMVAYATGFDEIKVYLSKNYYDGISNKFYLKNLKSDEIELLSGDVNPNNEEAGFRIYTLNASFEFIGLLMLMDFLVF